MLNGLTQMQLASHLMMLMAVVACRAAVIPNMMFSSAGRSRHGQQQKQYQPPHWPRPGSLSPWDDGTETYGYLADRHPNMMDELVAGFQQPQLQHQQQPLVYGVPHRYLSDPVPSYPMPSPTDELYNNALLMRGRSPYTAVKRSSLASYYDALNDDMVDENAVDDYDTPISRQDVINFENYVQRFFNQQPSVSAEDVAADVDNQYADDWALVPESGLEDSENEAASNYDAGNDEEAARQLHLLLNQQQQRRPVVALREIQKKSVAVPSTATTTTPTPISPRTEAPVTTATTTTTSSTTPSPQRQHHQGQKEEPLLRPPTPQRQPHQQLSSSSQVSTPATANVVAAENTKEDNSIYHTIQRLMNMRNQLQVGSLFNPFSVVHMYALRLVFFKA